MAPSPTIRRLLRETAELSSTSPNPNPAFHAAPVSDADLHEWHFTILGPPAPSPYAGGMYHGRITLPPAYPLKPPNFRFLTPSGRFEVNREICLSISGFHEETWMPAWGVRTALTALRSFMAEAGSAGQVGGLEANELVRKRMASESRAWRCDICQKSNEEGLREWWNNCREKGVQVEGDEQISLEALPDGLNLEARIKSPVSKQGDQGSLQSSSLNGERQPDIKDTGVTGLGLAQEGFASNTQQSSAISNSQLSEMRQRPSTVQSPISPSASQNPTPAISQIPPPSHSQITSPDLQASLPAKIATSLTPRSGSGSRSSNHSNTSSTSNSPRQRLTNDTIYEFPSSSTNTHQPISTSSTIPPSQNNPTSNYQSQSQSTTVPTSPPPSSSPNSAGQPTTTTTTNNTPQVSIPTLNSNINTIDRAIACVFLALCLMVLKKAFYPAGSSWEVDEYYLQRA